MYITYLLYFIYAGIQNYSPHRNTNYFSEEFKDGDNNGRLYKVKFLDDFNVTNFHDLYENGYNKYP